MKKIYQKPIITLESTEADSAILAGSPGLQAEGYDPAAEALSRENDVFAFDFD